MEAAGGESGICSGGGCSVGEWRGWREKVSGRSWRKKWFPRGSVVNRGECWWREECSEERVVERRVKND